MKQQSTCFSIAIVLACTMAIVSAYDINYAYPNNTAA